MGSILEDSSAYQIWLDLAKRDANREIAREIALDLGQRRFGPPTAEQEAALKAIKDGDRVKRICNRLLDAASWDELLATP